MEFEKGGKLEEMIDKRKKNVIQSCLFISNKLLCLSQKKYIEISEAS